MKWEPTDSPGALLIKIARLMGGVADGRLKPLGVTGGQIPIFAALINGESALSQTALAKLAQIEQPTMAATLTRMERDGLIQRRPDASDGRSSLISLTPAGLARAPQVMAILQGGRQEMLAGFDEAERQLLASMLRRVMANLEAAAGRDDGSAAAPTPAET